MVDNVTLQIETIAARCGSYKDAFFEFAEAHNIEDCEDLLEVISDTLKEKIKQEFIDKNYLPELKKNNLSDLFLS